MIKKIYEEAFSDLLIKEVRNECSLEDIEDFYNKYAAYDEGNELKHKVDYLRASILKKRNKFEEALEIYSRLHCSISTDNGAFFNISYEMIQLYLKLGELDKAVSLIDHYIINGNSANFFDYLTLLRSYVEVVKEKEKAIPDNYKKIFDQVKEYFRVTKLNSNSFVAEVKELHERNHIENNRYSRLLLLEDNEEKLEKLREFINEAQLDFYKDLAKEKIIEISLR